jgi:serine/threonine protein kinase
MQSNSFGLTCSPIYPENLDKLVVDLLKKMLTKDENERITAVEILVCLKSLILETSLGYKTGGCAMSTIQSKSY